MSDTLRFRFVDCRGEPGEWKRAFDRHWPAYRRWFLSEGTGRRQSYEAGARALCEQMPELSDLYLYLCRSAQADDIAARFLSMYCPPAYVTGCSQIAFRVNGSPFLLRNYDYSPRLFEATVMLTDWGGKAVIATIDSLWGCLDGLNQDGLAVSLAFGGSKSVGKGFGIPLILRYILQTCANTAEAIAALLRVNCNMSYNLTLTDRDGDARTVELFPGKPPCVLNRPFATNHQTGDHWPAYSAFTRSKERSAVLQQLSRDVAGSPSLSHVRAFQAPPLRSDDYERGFGTLYSCLLAPSSGQVEYIWANQRIALSFSAFTTCEIEVLLNAPLDRGAERSGSGVCLPQQCGV